MAHGGRGRGKGRMGSAGRPPGTPEKSEGKMEIDPNTGTPVCGVAGSCRKKDAPPLSSPPPPGRTTFFEYDRGSREFEETMGDIEDGFSVDKSLAENAVASAHFVYSIITKMHSLYEEERQAAPHKGNGNFAELMKFNTLVREVKTSVSQLADFSIAHESKSSAGDPPPNSGEFPASDVQASLQRIEQQLDSLRMCSSKSYADIVKETELSPSPGRAPIPVVGLATASPSVATFRPKKNSEVATFGSNIYQNALVFQNVNQEVPVQERGSFFVTLLNERLRGRLRPVSPGDIIDVTEERKKGSFVVFFCPGFTGVEAILENAFSFSESQKYEEIDRIYVSPLLSPDDIKFMSKARGMAVDICKVVFKDHDWWSNIKIYGVGYKLKMKTTTAVGQGSSTKTTYINLRGFNSPYDPTLKASIQDLVSKVRISTDVEV